LKRPFKIGVAGSHSTGKTTLVGALRDRIVSRNLRVGRVDDLAGRARDLGFPILREHTFESTLWIMAECMRQEAERSLCCDIILVDRPVLDALGYLKAALAVSGRVIEPGRLQALERIAYAHARDYDVLVVTILDPSIPLGPGRDDDPVFRVAASKAVAGLIDEARPDALRVTSGNSAEVIETVLGAIDARL
jgi:predicted ATPase